MGIHGHGTGVHRHTAFTVLELLVTLVIAAVLLLTAVPAFQQFSWRQHIRAALLRHGISGCRPYSAC